MKYKHSNQKIKQKEEIFAGLERLSKENAIKKTIKFIQTGSHVLDIGAGNCALSYLFAKKGAKCLALDSNSNEIDGLGVGKKFFRHHNLRFIHGNFEKLPFSNASFDIVFSRNALHHASDITAVFKEANRVLKPRGLFIFIEPARGALISSDFAKRKFNKIMPDFKREINEKIRSARGYAWLLIANKFECLDLDYLTSFRDMINTLKNRSIAGYCVSLGLYRLFKPLLKAYLYSLGFPIGIPHCFTKNMTGFEYFQIMGIARKINTCRGV